MPGENHLTYFKVQNFKRFKELEVKDIGQFNLVLGDNNVGKTSFLEALLINPENYFEYSSYYLLFALQFKNIGTNLKKTHWYFYVHQSGTLQKQIDLTFEYQTVNKKSQKWTLGYLFPQDEIRIELDGGARAISGYLNFDHLSKVNIKVPFIPYSYSYGSDLANYYEDSIQGNWKLKEALTASIRIMIPTLRDFEPSKKYSDQNSIVFWEKQRDSAIPLSMYGEGTSKLFRILTDIIIFKGAWLMIDEIDTGIHYSRMKDFWKTILLAAKENDVQLFATTHNLECIRYFKEALEETELMHLQKDARSITLVEHPKSKGISAHTFSFEALEHSVDAGNEIRGF